MASMSEEGVEVCAKFHDDLKTDGIKPIASSDLWSKNGLALFGLLSHGIQRTPPPLPADFSVWKMRELLAGAVPCSKDHHTGHVVATLNADAFKRVRIYDVTTGVFLAKTDNASNMIKGYENMPHDACACHTIELSVNPYVEHPGIAPTIAMARAQAGYLHSSTIGQSDFNDCQRELGLPETGISQDVQTRWRSTHGLCEDMRANQKVFLIFEVPPGPNPNPNLNPDPHPNLNPNPDPNPNPNPNNT